MDKRPSLWSSDQSFWLQIRRPGFDSRALQGKKVVDLERGPLSLVSTTEELLGWNSSGSSLESREYGRRDSSRWPRGTLYPQKKLALTSLTSVGRYSSLAGWGHGFFLWWTKTTDPAILSVTIVRALQILSGKLLYDSEFCKHDLLMTVFNELGLP
jgi:hypothetical protein